MDSAYMASSSSSLLKVAVVTFMKIMVLSWMYVLNYKLKFSQDACIGCAAIQNPCRPAATMGLFFWLTMCVGVHLSNT
jgi:hypothetical protein